MRWIRLIGTVLLAAILLAASTAVAGWLMWHALLYLIQHSK
jgi:hypothetical protein